MVLEYSVRKLINQYFIVNTNVLSAPNVSMGFGTVNALKKLKSILDANETNNFRKTAKPVITKIVQNLLESSSLRYPLDLFV